ncbi:helix-turn-helix transcriptional regulator [Saccharopolyspora sp. ASAGF58]|uniref:helix-turn-helix domain-containing protein n=1 Tax=Saccharopolyspora sp. ASAGF58 TaxID=2719023 RepID=UPI00143FC307|nr:helix-turn-helix transcriptional regulator [Saccharopolyspora sp. ASAGF58]QIZ34779.1 helix-turn-helix domain-containing protein [Saccharopolyspora sp. ASAGF58]
MARQSETVVDLRRALGAMLAKQRESARIRQSELARKTHYSRTSISHIEAGRQFPARDFWKKADEICKCNGVLLAEYDAAVAEEASNKVADLFSQQNSASICEQSWFSNVSSDDGDQIEAVELVRRASASDVTSETLDMLEAAFDDLASSYTTTPPNVLIQRVRQHLRYVHKLLDGRMSLADHRRLLVIGGWLSLLGATVHVDLQQDAAATARLRTAASLAREVNHAEIRAWCYETEAWRVLTQGDFARASDLARSAVQLAPGGSSVAIQATAQIGRANARLGQAEETYESIKSVHQMVSPMQRPERPEHHYRYDPDKSLAYTATTLAWLGDSAAEEYAREVIKRLGPTSDSSKWPRRVAAANLDLALALLASDRLDEACATAMRAIASGRVVPSNHWRALEVVKAVESRQLPEARDLREAYEALPRG